MAVRLGMIVFRNTVCSSSTNGTKYTYSSRRMGEDALASVTVGIRVLQDVEQIAPFNVEDDLLKPDTSLFPEPRVLRVVPGEVLH